MCRGALGSQLAVTPCGQKRAQSVQFGKAALAEGLSLCWVGVIHWDQGPGPSAGGCPGQAQGRTQWLDTVPRRWCPLLRSWCVLLAPAASRETCPQHCLSLVARLQEWHWRWPRGQSMAAVLAVGVSVS